jgi:hypothetical protein
MNEAQEKPRAVTRMRKDKGKAEAYIPWFRLRYCQSIQYWSENWGCCMIGVAGTNWVMAWLKR